MKKNITLLLLVCTVYSFSAFAQPGTICNAGFTFAVNGSNNIVQFSPTSINTSALLQHQWIFGDGTTGSNLINPLHEYTAAGSYYVTHMVTYRSPNDSNVVQCYDSIGHLVTINGFPTCTIHSAFSFVRDSVQTNKVYFNNLSTGTTPNTVVKWYFGDGTFSYDNNPVHIYQTSGAYTVCLAVKRDSLCADDTCKMVQVQVPANTCNLQAYFTSQVDSSDRLLVHFFNQTAQLSSTDSVRWVLGDGSSSTDLNPSHTYNQGGVYNVCLIVKRNIPGTLPCVREYCQAITVLSTPPPPPACTIHAAFSFVRDSIQTNKVYFNNLSTGTTPNTVVKWYFGDGTFSYDNNPAHIYQTPGAYTVCVAVKRDSLCADDTCKMVQVQVPPVNSCDLQPYFSSQVDSVNYLRIHFFNLTPQLASTDSVRWTFGDGSSSSDLNPAHTYNQGGTYNVCLLIRRNIPGTVPCVREYCHAVLVLQQSQCNVVPDFVPYRDSVNANPGYTINFQNTSLFITNLDSSFWDFGDGTTAVSGHNNSVSHTFSDTGYFTVCLKVKKMIPGSTALLCERQVCKIIFVAAPAPTCNVNAAFTWNAETVNRRKIHFNNTTTGANSGYVLWIFGDGYSGSGWNEEHVYAQPGRYIVQLAVFVNDHCTDHMEDTITVLPSSCDSSQVSFNYHHDSYQPNKLYFFASASTLVTQQQWSFIKLADTNAAVVIHQNNPVYIFNDTGAYVVCLRAVLQNGCIKESCDEVMITSTSASPNCILAAYPNPAVNTVSVNVQLQEAQPISVAIYDLQGISVSQLTQQGMAGNNLVTLNIQSLAPGFYNVRILYGGRVCYTRFQKI